MLRDIYTQKLYSLGDYIQFRKSDSKEKFFFS